MKHFKPEGFIAAAFLLATPYTANAAVDVAWTYGNQEISASLYIGGDGTWGMGEVTSIQNTDTLAYEYQIGVQPNFYLLDFHGSGVTFNSLSAGTLILNDAAGATINIFNEASNTLFNTALNTALTSNTFGVIQAEKAASNNFTSPIWLQFKTDATTTIFQQPGSNLGNTGCSAISFVAGSDCNPLTYNHLSETGTATLTGGTEMARLMAMSGVYGYSALYDIQGFGPHKGSVGWSDNAGNNITLSVPEPTTMTLFSAGLLGMAASRRKAKQA